MPKGFPTTTDGHVTDPDYLPPMQAQEYRRKLGEWARANPRSAWPEWLARYIERKRGEGKKPTEAAA
jgi:hypothetical protein